MFTFLIEFICFIFITQIKNLVLGMLLFKPFFPLIFYNFELVMLQVTYDQISCYLILTVI